MRLAARLAVVVVQRRRPAAPGEEQVAAPVVVTVEGGDATGLGLLDLEIVFGAEKHLANPVGTAWGEPVRGYEIHYGRVARSGDLWTIQT